MKSIFSRLMMGSATIALGLAGAAVSGAPAMATAVATCTGSPCPVDGAPWTVTNGTVTLSGGTYSPSSVLVETDETDAAIDLTNGANLSDDAIIGDASSGSFDNNNSTHNVAGQLILGNQSTGSGIYTIEGNTAQTNVQIISGGNSGNPNGALIVGNAGTGNFTQGMADQSDTGNAVNVDGDVVLGSQSGSTGTYTLNTGTLTVGGILTVGSYSSASNLFTQNGGLVSLTGSAAFNSDYAPVNQNPVPSTFPGTVYVGGESVFNSGQGTYQMNGGELDAAQIFVGFSGTGTFNQANDSTVSVTSYVDLGGCGGCNGSNSAGFYNISGTATLTDFGAMTIGDFGHAEFTQSDDSLVIVGQNLSIANGVTPLPNTVDPGQYDRSGTYTLNGGILETQNTIVGAQGTGTFIQTGGSHQVAIELDLGQTYQPLNDVEGTGTPGSPIFGGPASGTYTMSGGTLTANASDSNGVAIIVGDAGTGLFTQTGGSVTAGVLDSGLGDGFHGDLIIGAQGFDVDDPNHTATPPSGGTGTYNIGKTGQSIVPTLQVYGDMILGRDASTVSGALPSNGTLNVAGNGTSVSVDTFTGTSPFDGGNMVVGLSGNGTVTQKDASVVTVANDVAVGVNSTATGSYSISGGSLSVGANLYVGGSGSDPGTPDAQTDITGGFGNFAQSGGAVHVSGALGIGQAGGTGDYNLSGGSLVVDNVTYVSGNSTGTFEQSNGSFTTAFLNVGILGGGTGTYTMTGGTLDVTANFGIGGPNATGSMDQQAGGSVTVADDLYLNAGDGGSAGYTIHSGAILTVGTNSGNAAFGSIFNPQNSLVVGNGDCSSACAASTFHQVAGTVNVGGDTTGSSGNAGVQDLILGSGINSTGKYTIDGGVLNVYGNTSTSNSAIEVGFLNGNATGGGNGLFVQNGGTVNTYGVLGLAIGDDSLAVHGTAEYDLSKGSLNINQNPSQAGSGLGDGSSSGVMFVGANDSGVLKQTGGSVAVAGDVLVGFRNNATPTVGTWTIDSSAGNGAPSATIGGNMFVGGTSLIGSAGTGEVDQASGSVSVTGKLEVGGGATGSSGTYKLTGGTLSAGSMAVGKAGSTDTASFSANGGSATIHGDVTVNGSGRNGGNVNVAGGSVLDASGHNYNQTAGTTQVDGQIKAAVTNIGGGLLEGTGIITGNVVATGGTVKPGDSPGTLTVQGTYEQQIAAVFEVDISGRSNPSQVGKLAVTGAATLGGTLDIELVSGFGPLAENDDFRILDFASSLGNFNAFIFDGTACSTDITSCDIGTGLQLTEVFSASGLDLKVISTNPNGGGGGGGGVPEPWTLAVFGVGLAGLVFVRRRKAAPVSIH